VDFQLEDQVPGFTSYKTMGNSGMPEVTFSDVLMMEGFAFK
jgi:hypothetical protein